MNCTHKGLFIIGAYQFLRSQSLLKSREAATRRYKSLWCLKDIKLCLT